MENRRLKYVAGIPLWARLGGFLLFFGVLGYAGCLVREKKNPFAGYNAGKTKLQEKAPEIYVHIAGEVKNPGLYRIEYGTRFGELIDEAGGLTSTADVTGVNLAALLSDGQKIIIPAGKNIFEKMGVGKAPRENYINPPVRVEKDK